MATEMIPTSIAKIRAHIPFLTKAEQRVATYIVDNPQEAIYQSVSGLAECSDTSDATVIRTCKALGFSNYQDFKVTLAQAIANRDQTINGSFTIEDNAPVKTIVDSVFDSTIQTLRLTQGDIDLVAIEKAAEMLLHARHVFVTGMGASHAIANDLEHKLLRLGIETIYQPDEHLQRIMLCTQARQGDVLFAISFSGSSRDVVENTKIAKEMGARVITMTGFGKSPLSNLADIALHTMSDESKHSFSVVSSRIAQMAIIDVLHTVISNRNKSYVIEKISAVNKHLQSLKY